MVLYCPSLYLRHKAATCRRNSGFWRPQNEQALLQAEVKPHIDTSLLKRTILSNVVLTFSPCCVWFIHSWHSLTLLGYLPALRRTERPGPISRCKRIIDSKRHTMMTLYLPPLHIMHTFTHRRCIGSYNSVAAPSFQTNLHPVETKQPKEREASEHRKVQRKQQSAVSHHPFQCKHLYPHMRVCRWNC